jgi:hypothetical protein
LGNCLEALVGHDFVIISQRKSVEKRTHWRKFLMWKSDPKREGVLVHEEPVSAYLNNYESVLLVFGGNCRSELSKSEKNIQ